MSRVTCCALVWSAGAWRSYPCQKPAKVERDGKHYCGIHDPVRRAEKQAVRDAEFSARIESKRQARMTADAERAETKRRADAYPALLEALVRLMKWAEPIAGDNRDKVAEAEEIASVEQARAAIAKAEGREP